MNTSSSKSLKGSANKKVESDSSDDDGVEGEYSLYVSIDFGRYILTFKQKCKMSGIEELI